MERLGLLARPRSKQAWGRRSCLVAVLAVAAFMTALLALISHSHISADEGKFLLPRRNAARSGLCNRDLYPPVSDLSSEQVTVLVNGFSESRIPFLERNARMLSASEVIHSVYILWGNASTGEQVLQAADFESLGAPIYVVRQPSSSLNDRFLPRDYVKTKAVVICDDDISIELKSLKVAFRVWKENQGRIVGFFPRSHLYHLGSRSWVYTKQPDRYSIMLTKFMILATEFLYLYTCKLPAGVKEYVDDGLNCEDIAMNFLVASYSRQGPLLVEGDLRDLGDTRNSDTVPAGVALSSRTGHRKDRGQCIGAFHKLWKEMPLRYSLFKAVADVKEPALCDRYGLAIDCDANVVSRRQGLRYLGKSLAVSSSRFAYVTLLSSNETLKAALGLAESLRSTGTIYDIVLLVCGMASKGEELELQFDEVKYLEEDTFEVSSLWQLTEYTKIVFIDAASVVLSSLDHLFERPEIAAAPHPESPGMFDARLFVLKPSNETYSKMVERNQKLGTARSMEWFLNRFFSDWFYLPIQHRLPTCYSVPVDFPWKPLGFERKSTYRRIGSPLVLHGANGTRSYPARFSSPEQTRLESNEAGRKPSAMATVLWNQRAAGCLDVWLRTYNSTAHRRHRLLLVVSSLNRQAWSPYADQFDSVEVVEPILPGEATASLAMLQLWNQTQFSKLLYVDACSIFVQNCDFFFDYDGPLAASPSGLPADTFSTGLMVVQPCQSTFKLLLSRARAGAVEQGVEGHLNSAFASQWYEGSAATHRIHPSLVQDARFGKPRDDEKTKVLVFPSSVPTWSSVSSWSLQQVESIDEAWTKTRRAVDGGGG